FPEGKTMPVPFVTSRSAFTVIGDGTGLWVTGALQVHIHLPNGNWTNGPDLPIALYSHCLVHVNESFTFLAGGYVKENEGINKAWAFDWTSSNYEMSFLRNLTSICRSWEELN
ncbi:hypothetical protein FKW44_001063, partial [Caligus rogercresseyi]